MSDLIIRAWKDPKFRAELSANDKSDVPENPAGKTWNESDPDELDDVAGGAENPTTITNSGGHVCTATTECPWFTLCCGGGGSVES